MTDVRDHSSLQTAVDHAISQNGVVFIPDGMDITLNHTLRLGRADGGLSSVSLVSGHAGNYRGHVGKGASIRTTFSKGPAIAVVGQRRCTIEGITFAGKNLDYIQANNLGGGSPAFLDTDAAAWWNPALDPNGNSRYEPYSAIAIDPYATGGASSGVKIDDVMISGFAAGVAIQPANRDGNGDFVSLEGTKIEHCVYSVSVGQTQARLLNITNSELNNCHTLITGRAHGRQMGALSGLVSGTGLSICSRLIDCSSALGFGLQFSGCHGELIHQLGSFGGVASANRDAIFDSSILNLSYVDAMRGIPARFTDGDQGRIRLRFNGGSLALPTLMASAHQIVASGLQIQNSDGEAASSPSPERKRLHNWAGGYLRSAPYMAGDFGGEAKRVAVYRNDGTVSNDWHRTTGGVSSSRDFANIVKPRFGAIDFANYATPQPANVWAKRPGDVWSGLTGTIDLPSNVTGVKAGDLLMCGATDMACLVEAASGAQAQVRALNNWRDAGDGPIFIEPIDGNNWWWFST